MRLSRWPWLVVSLLWFGVRPAQAGRFETVHGPTHDFVDEGRRVIPVQWCADAGGWLVLARSAGSAAYLARLAEDGSALWERSYRIGSTILLGGVVEMRDGSGYVIAGGYSVPGGDDRSALLLKVGCDGAVAWARAYDGGGQDFFTDVVQASTGDPKAGTFADDLLVSGNAGTPSVFVEPHGFLLRASPDGDVRWSRRYDLTGAGWPLNAFNRLIEMPRTDVSPTGDVVVVGWVATAPLSGGEGLAMRVSGNDGAIRQSPHCAAVYNGASTTAFVSVTTSLRRHPVFSIFYRELILAGVIGERDAFVVRTGASPCDALVRRRIGAPSVHEGERIATNHEIAHDVVADYGDDPFGLPGPLRGVKRLAIAGQVGVRLELEHQDAFLVLLDPVTLEPLADSGRLFGGSHLDRALALAPVPGGFVMAGQTWSMRDADGELRQIYVLRTDSEGRTGCERAWNPPHAEDDAIVTRVTPVLRPAPDSAGDMSVQVEMHDTGLPVCPRRLVFPFP